MNAIVKLVLLTLLVALPSVSFGLDKVAVNEQIIELADGVFLKCQFVGRTIEAFEIDSLECDQVPVHELEVLKKSSATPAKKETDKPSKFRLDLMKGGAAAMSNWYGPSGKTND